eukprot:jgi/Psemu1/38754/gm1.38754_g
MDSEKKESEFTLEKRLFHTLHKNQCNLLSIKEFKECYAFCNAVRKAFGKKKGKSQGFDVVIDVAGGHGALGAMFLICTPAYKSIILDPADVGGGRIQQAWEDFMGSQKQLTYRRECLRTGLPDELGQALQSTTRDRILVVASLDENEIIESRRHSQAEIDKAHSKLELVYRKAHTVPGPGKPSRAMTNIQHFVVPSSVWCIAAGFAAGFLSATSIRKR